MGRRALRKIDPELDLSRHFLPLEDLPRPLSGAALFGREAPLEVEVGSGKGLFLESAAPAMPERDFLGLEIAHKFARFAAARLARLDLPNAKVACGDALWVFRDLVPDASLAAAHVYFPDPWWKKRHHKRRVMKAEFLKDVERTLQPGGSLHFWTDVEDYFKQTLELLAEHTALAGPLAVEEKSAEHDRDYRTHFERRMRLHGQPVYRAEFRKPG